MMQQKNDKLTPFSNSIFVINFSHFLNSSDLFQLTICYQANCKAKGFNLLPFLSRDRLLQADLKAGRQAARQIPRSGVLLFAAAFPGVPDSQQEFSILLMLAVIERMPLSISTMTTCKASLLRFLSQSFVHRLHFWPEVQLCR